MKVRLKRLLESVAPSVLDAYRSINNRRLFGRRFRSLHLRAQIQFYKGGKIEVLSGPFKGLRYFNETVWGPITPKWLGSYELELHGIVEEIITEGYSVVVDVGCAEGYYAAGLAYRIPTAQVFAYDTDFLSRRQTEKLLELNELEARVSVCRYCTNVELARHHERRTLIICDIEGFERTLLDPLSCPSLLRFDILVEVHESDWTPSTFDLLTTRFAATHFVREVNATDRQTWIQFMMTDARFAENRELLCEAVEEHRSNGRTWLWMKAKVPNKADAKPAAAAVADRSRWHDQAGVGHHAERDIVSQHRAF